MNFHDKLFKSTKTEVFQYILCVVLGFSAMFLTHKTWGKKYAQRMLHTVSLPNFDSSISTIIPLPPIFSCLNINLGTNTEAGFLIQGNLISQPEK